MESVAWLALLCRHVRQVVYVLLHFVSPPSSTLLSTKLYGDGECDTDCAGMQGVLFLAEVALGKQYKTPSTEYLDYKKVRDRGCDSTHGMGNMEPAEAGSVAMYVTSKAD